LGGFLAPEDQLDEVDSYLDGCHDSRLLLFPRLEVHPGSSRCCPYEDGVDGWKIHEWRLKLRAELMRE
jgi:hypothetical protein